MKSRKMEKKQVGAVKVRKKVEKVSSKQTFFLIFVGAIIGLINGFLGGGGGMICVPLLEKVLKIPSKKAHASAIAVIFPLSFISAIIYTINGSIESLPLLTIGLGVIAGGILGSFLLKILPAKVIGVIFACLMLAAGVRMLI